MLDGDDAAVVEIDLVEALNATEQTGGSEVVLDGDLRTSATTAFDLADGSVRRGPHPQLRARSTCSSHHRSGVVAPAVEARRDLRAAASPPTRARADRALRSAAVVVVVVVAPRAVVAA